MAAESMTPEQLAKMRLLSNNLEVYSAHCLKILGKEGGQKLPFLWNRAQRYVHACLEQQLAETGRVRALVLKGRQQGISTYVGARYYHKTTMGFGMRAFIVAHEQKATDNLFAMVKRYHENNPMPISTGATNAKELIFDKLDGGYKLATAGSKDVGRGNTAQLLHGSEFGFWDNAAMHLAGLGNTIASQGTEIILESTANGLGNQFHTMWQAAERGEGDYIAVFVPWFWQPEYRAVVRKGFELSAEDREYQQAYGLDLEQMQFRANKISEYGPGHEWLFDQEYPATAALAFKTSTQNPLISPNLVMAAANGDYREREGPLIIGCDPAGDGDGDADRTAIAFRQGRTCFRLEYHDKKNTMQIAGLLTEYWNQFKPDGIIVDKGGLGAGIYDRLIEANVPAIGVNNAERARDSERYENIRAEMWWLMQEWFANQPCRIPNNAALIADVCAPQPDIHSSGRKLLESKKKMAKRGIRSPDGGDALALTFAVPVTKRVDELNAYRTGSGYKAPTSAGY